eukprot:EG_transcript_26577
MTDFEYPACYFLPPFFFLQPVLDTQQKQKQMWGDLVIAYCRHHRLFEIDAGCPLFCNKAIGRTLPTTAWGAVMQLLVDQGRAEWTDSKRKDRCFVYWTTPAGWADAIRAWATETGNTNTVCTIHELCEGDTGQGTPFEGIARPVLLKALRLLEKAGRAALIAQDGEVEGVKFF